MGQNNTINQLVTGTNTGDNAVNTLYDGLLSGRLLAPTSNQTIAAGYSAYLSDYYEVVDTYYTEVGDDSILEIG